MPPINAPKKSKIIEKVQKLQKEKRSTKQDGNSKAGGEKSKSKNTKWR